MFQLNTMYPTVQNIFYIEIVPLILSLLFLSTCFSRFCYGEREREKQKTNVLVGLGLAPPLPPPSPPPSPSLGKTLSGLNTATVLGTNIHSRVHLYLQSIYSKLVLFFVAWTFTLFSYSYSSPHPACYLFTKSFPHFITVFLCMKTKFHIFIFRIELHSHRIKDDRMEK